MSGNHWGEGLTTTIPHTRPSGGRGPPVCTHPPQQSWAVLGCGEACHAKEAKTGGLEIEHYIVPEGMGSSERRADTTQTNKAHHIRVHSST
jgi:hypothetical protein